MKVSIALIAAVGLAWPVALHGTETSPPKPAKRPNIIVVLSDDVGLSRVSCYGGAPFQTPHLDQLAATGLRFERCYSMPICGPSRAALLTGKYPFRTGATNNGNSTIDPREHPTIANVLRDAGYATCAIGKLGQSAPEDDVNAPLALGFDEYMLWMGRGTPDRYLKPRYCRNGEFMQGRPEEFGPDLTHEFLVDFMKRNRKRPFFVYYSAVLAHLPLTTTPDSKPGARPDDLLVDMVRYLDKQMGRLADDLERLSLRENTIILFTSDNGPAGNPLGTIRGAPMIGKKGDVTEGGVRAPLIVNCPALVPAGRVSPDLSDFTDLFPTVLELAGVSSPQGLKLDGRSIAPQILGRTGQPREWVYAQHGAEYFIADQRRKLYEDGRFVDITDSPVAEKTVSENDGSGAAARKRLSAALSELRAGVTEKERLQPAPTAADLSPENRKANLRFLAELNIIDRIDPWLDDSGKDGAQVAALMVNAAGKYGKATTVEEAIAVLKRKGIVTGPDYWMQHATAGQKCNADNVAKLVHKLAASLRAR
jgi:arylsulfatase A